jgi:hypothetical protein
MQLSDMPRRRKNILQILPQILFFILKKKKHKTTKHAIWK